MRSRGADSDSPGQGDDFSYHAEGKGRSWWKVSACVQNQQAGKWKRANSHKLQTARSPRAVLADPCRFLQRDVMKNPPAVREF